MIRSPAAQSLGLPAYNWWEEATHGVTPLGKSGDATNVAFPITTAMSFNRSLWKATGAMIGTEARALMNIGKAGSDFWAPVINLARDGRWGRNLETPGEDPYLSGEYATQFVRGFQQSEDDPGHLLASACCKHYVANSLEYTTENSMSWNRFEFDANVTQQDLVDSYMPPFQACVEKGEVSGLMCSLNALNGVPACANDWLMNRVARSDWGFRGYITTDCDGYPQSYQYHNYSGSPEAGVRDMLRAGLDIDCSFGSGIALDVNTMRSALQVGMINETDIELALQHLFSVRMRLGHFDPPGPLQSIAPSVICSAEHAVIARNGAAQGTTLLKNQGKALPLNSATLNSVAVIGPNGDLSKAIAGYYGAGRPCNGTYSTMVDAVQQYVQNTTFVKGVPGVASTDTSGVADASAAAKVHDATVLVVGTDLGTAHEGHDATNLTLSPAQMQLITAVATAARQPVVVVIMSAVPLDVGALLSNPKVGAIVWVGQPSVQCLGVGDVLFGRYAAAGRMVTTLYPVEVQHQLSIFDMNMRPGPSTFPRPDGRGCKPGNKSVPCSNRTAVGMCTPDVDCAMGTNPGRTHRFFNGSAVIPFGFGLSYTTFTYNIVAAPAATLSLAPVQALLADSEANKHSFPSLFASQAPAAAPAKYLVNVSNTGLIDSDDVVLGFIFPPNAGVDGMPLQSLFGFERVFIKANETVTVSLYPDLTQFMRVNRDGTRVAMPGEYRVHFGLRESASLGTGYAEHRFTMA